MICKHRRRWTGPQEVCVFVHRLPSAAPASRTGATDSAMFVPAVGFILAGLLLLMRTRAMLRDG